MEQVDSDERVKSRFERIVRLDQSTSSFDSELKLDLFALIRSSRSMRLLQVPTMSTAEKGCVELTGEIESLPVERYNLAACTPEGQRIEVL